MLVARQPGVVKLLYTLLIAIALTMAGTVRAADLTAIYDFRYLAQNDFPALVYEFEGLAFTDDGRLWASIAANPRRSLRALWKLNLQSNTVEISIPDTLYGRRAVSPLLNPVGLAGAGNQLIVAENLHELGNVIWAFRPNVATSTPSNPDWSFRLPARICNEVEGAAFAGGMLYVTCQNDGTIREIEPITGALGRTFALGGELLGLEMMDDTRLLIGDYSNHQLLVFDLVTGRVTEAIDLESLFTGADSDYFRLTGEIYSVVVVPGETARTMPDPDCLAYRNGKIYMSFDGDLRIFEISATPLRN